MGEIVIPKKIEHVSSLQHCQSIVHQSLPRREMGNLSQYCMDNFGPLPAEPNVTGEPPDYHLDWNTRSLCVKRIPTFSRKTSNPQSCSSRCLLHIQMPAFHAFKKAPQKRKTMGFHTPHRRGFQGMPRATTFTQDTRAASTLHLMRSSLLRKRAVNDAALVRGFALDLPLDAEDVLPTEGHHSVS